MRQALGRRIPLASTLVHSRGKSALPGSVALLASQTTWRCQMMLALHHPPQLWSHLCHDSKAVTGSFISAHGQCIWFPGHPLSWEPGSLMEVNRVCRAATSIAISGAASSFAQVTLAMQTDT